MAGNNSQSNTNNTQNSNTNTTGRAGMEYQVQQYIALEELSQLRSKVGKIKSLANQGEYQQDGMLSGQQTKMYSNLLKEIESIQARHKQKLLAEERKYQSMIEQEQQKRIEKSNQLLSKVENAQQDYNSSRGANKWGNVADEETQLFYKTKLDDAIQEYEKYQSSMNDPLPKEISELSDHIKQLNNLMTSMETQQVRADYYSERVDNLQVRDDGNSSNTLLGKSILNSTTRLLSNLGMITSLNGYLSYSKAGATQLRSQENLAFNISQKMGLSGKDVDSDVRDESAQTSLRNGYITDDTLRVQNLMVSGGAYKSTKDLQEDTYQAQQFGRAFAVNPEDLVQNSTLLNKLGAMDEGDMQKLSQFIAGAIKQGNMAGREEEYLKSAYSLISNTSSQQAGMSLDQVSSILNLQSQLGAYVPSLAGEKGTQMLTNLNSSIQNGATDNVMAQLMGWGTEFQGLEGREEMLLEMEKGITPQNLQRILKNGERMTGSYKSSVLKQLLSTRGVSISQFNAMEQSGMLEKALDGTLTQEDLASVGVGELEDKTASAQDTATYEQLNVDSMASETKVENSKLYDDISKKVRGWFHSLPDAVKKGLIGTSAVGGTYTTLKYSKSLLNGARGLFSGGSGTASTVAEAVGRGVSSSADDVASGVLSSGDDIARGLLGASDDVVRGASGAARATSVLAKGAKALPYVATGVQVVADRLEDPDGSWIKTGLKAGGSLAGGILGGGAGAVGGPAGIVAGSIAGGMAGEALGEATYVVGEKVVDKAVEGINYLGDKISDWLTTLRKDEDKETTKKVSKIEDPQVKPISEALLSRDTSPWATKLKDITDSQNTQVASKQDDSKTKKVVNTQETETKEREIRGSIYASNQQDTQVIEIKVTGKIDGMTDQNQKTISTSLANYFSSYKYGLNLSNQYARG